MANNISKKAPATILNWVRKYKKDASGFTTLDQAWDILSEKLNVEGSLIMSERPERKVVFTLLKNNDTIQVFEWPGNDAYNNYDFNYTLIFKEVLEFMKKNKKLLKDKKITKKQK